VSKQSCRDAFVGAAEQGFEELQAWCEAHPKYTLLELEEQVLAIRQRLMGQVMSTMVAQRGAGRPQAEGVNCPKCGGKMENKGQRSRTVGGPEGPIELNRVYCYCPSCKEGFSPSGPRVAADPSALD
jgi:hypothetical protein